MSATAPLLTVEDFAAGTGGKVSTADPRVAPLIAGATAGIRRYCGWHIAPVITEAVTLDGPGGRLLSFKTLRLVEILSLSERGEVLPVADLEWSELGNVMRRRGRWTDRFRGITAEIRHGYESAPDVVQIIQQVVANACASPMGATREQAGQLSVAWATTAPGVSGGISLLERDFAVLDLYRIRDA